jgi:hypothetical protein
MQRRYADLGRADSFVDPLGLAHPEISYEPPAITDRLGRYRGNHEHTPIWRRVARRIGGLFVRQPVLTQEEPPEWYGKAALVAPIHVGEPALVEGYRPPTSVRVEAEQYVEPVHPYDEPGALWRLLEDRLRHYGTTYEAATKDDDLPALAAAYRGVVRELAAAARGRSSVSISARGLQLHLPELAEAIGNKAGRRAAHHITSTNVVTGENGGLQLVMPRFARS